MSINIGSKIIMECLVLLFKIRFWYWNKEKSPTEKQAIMPVHTFIKVMPKSNGDR